MTFKIKDGVQVGTVNVFDNAGNLLVNAPSLTTTLAVAKGGTGATTLTGVVYGTGATAMRAATAAEIVAGIGATAVANAAAVPWSGVSARPTNLAGYGILDAALASHTHPADTLATVTAAGATTATAVSFTNATASSSSSTGALVVSGGVGIGGALNVGTNLVVGGNLTVNGTTNSVNSTVSTLVDPVLDIGGGAGGAAPTGADTSGRGFKFQYFSGTAKSGFIGWDQADGCFKLIPDATWGTGNVPSGTVGNFKAGWLSASNGLYVTSGLTQLSGTLQCDSLVNLNPSSGHVNIKPSGIYNVNIQPQGTGTVTIAPVTTVGAIDNCNIGSSTPGDGKFDWLSATTVDFNGAITLGPAAITTRRAGVNPWHCSDRVMGFTFAVTSAMTIYQRPVASVNSVKFTVHLKQGTKRQISEILLSSDGTTTYMTEYGVLETNGSLGSFTSSVDTGNLNLSVTLAAAIATEITLAYLEFGQ